MNLNSCAGDGIATGAESGVDYELCMHKQCHFRLAAPHDQSHGHLTVGQPVTLARQNAVHSANTARQHKHDDTILMCILDCAICQAMHLPQTSRVVVLACCWTKNWCRTYIEWDMRTAKPLHAASNIPSVTIQSAGRSQLRRSPSDTICSAPGCN